jgi:arylsulfatase A-like enzyme
MMPPRYHNFAALIGLVLFVGFVLALALTIQVTLDNSYISYGFYRTVVYIFSGNLARLLLPATAAAVILAVVSVAWSKLRGSVNFFLPRMLGLLAGLAFFVRQGYVYNRYELPVNWGQRHEFYGFDLPEPLFLWQMWKANFLITLTALAIGLVVWLLCRTALRNLSGPGRRFWHAMGHPAAIILMLILIAGPIIAAKTLRSYSRGLPNIVLVSLDALRVDHLGCYGYYRATSPEMDHLAAEGIRFEWAFSQAPTTLISHTSTLTSLYPTVHKAQLDRRIGGRPVTLTEYLREHGYRTAGCTDGGHMRGRFGFNQGFECYDDEHKGSAVAIPRILEWLDSGLSDGPFFLLFHTYDIHSPYTAPEPYRDMFTDPNYESSFEPTASELVRIYRRVEAHPSKGHGLTEDDLDFIVGRYDGGIRWVDDWIGRLVRGLEERRLLDNTWVVITADHGEEFAEHGSLLHSKLYHTCTHVPLIIRPPKSTSKGQRIPEIVELIDLMPTFLELVGIAPVDTLQGQSLLPLIRGEAEHWDNLAYSEFPPDGARSVTTPTLHVIASFERGEVEVFDYRADRTEQSVLEDPSRAEEINDLVEMLYQWSRAQMLLATRQEGTVEVDLDLRTIKELRALGYID